MNQTGKVRMAFTTWAEALAEMLSHVLGLEWAFPIRFIARRCCNDTITAGQFQPLDPKGNARHGLRLTSTVDYPYGKQLPQLPHNVTWTDATGDKAMLAILDADGITYRMSPMEE